MKKWRTSDLPVLRSMRSMYRRILDVLNDMKREESDIEGLLTLASMIDSMQAKYDAAGRALDRLERSPR